MGCQRLIYHQKHTSKTESTPIFEIGQKQRGDYQVFGVQLDGRTHQSDSYRYGFQGQEKDDEIKGEGNSINYKYRMHDPRVGRFFAVDPLAPKYPHNSPYAFSENKVIAWVELEGLEAWPTNPESTPENTFSWEEYQSFSSNLLNKLTASELDFDCADLAIYVYMKYHEYKGVEFTYEYDGRTISSNDEEFKSFDDFFSGQENAHAILTKTGNWPWKRNPVKLGARGLIGAKHLYDGAFGLTQPINEQDIKPGDIQTQGIHTQMFVGAYFDERGLNTPVVQGNPGYGEYGGLIPEYLSFQSIYMPTFRFTPFNNPQVQERRAKPDLSGSDIGTEVVGVDFSQSVFNNL